MPVLECMITRMPRSSLATTKGIEFKQLNDSSSHWSSQEHVQLIHKLTTNANEILMKALPVIHSHNAGHCFETRRQHLALIVVKNTTHITRPHTLARALIIEDVVAMEECLTSRIIMGMVSITRHCIDAISILTSNLPSCSSIWITEGYTRVKTSVKVYSICTPTDNITCPQ